MNDTTVQWKQVLPALETTDATFPSTSGRHVLPVQTARRFFATLRYELHQLASWKAMIIIFLQQDQMMHVLFIMP